MNEAAGTFLVQQLTFLLPSVIVCLVGLVLALVFMGRHPLPSVLTLAATFLLLITAVAAPLIQSYLFQLREEANWPTDRFAMAMSLVGVGASIVRAVALALLVAAVFVGRGRVADISGFPEK